MVSGDRDDWNCLVAANRVKIIDLEKDKKLIIDADENEKIYI